MSRWKLAIIYCSHVFITDRHDVSLYSKLSANASKSVFLFVVVLSGAQHDKIYIHFVTYLN